MKAKANMPFLQDNLTIFPNSAQKYKNFYSNRSFCVISFNFVAKYYYNIQE